MKLFLSSYFSGAATLFAAWTHDAYAGKRVAFIPTASKHEKVTFYVDADKKALVKLGLIVDVLDVSEVPSDETAQRLDEAACIFVEGGNTFFLLQELRRTGADARIRAQAAGGKLYVGASAGSMVAAASIEYARLMDKPSAAPELNGDYAALGLVDFCVVPHFTNFPFKKAAEKIVQTYGDTLDLRPVSNHQAIVVEDGVATLLSAEKK